jgi:hypothetical protein
LITVTIVGPDEVQSTVEIRDDKKERCKCHTVYHEGRGRRYGDCRKGVIETLPAGYVPLVNILAKRTISFLADFEE